MYEHHVQLVRGCLGALFPVWPVCLPVCLSAISKLGRFQPNFMSLPELAKGCLITKSGVNWDHPYHHRFRESFALFA